MLVVDASVIVKLFVSEPDTLAASSATQSDVLVTPAHGFAEVGEVLARKHRAGAVTAEQVAAALDAMPRRIAPMPLLAILRPAVDLSLETGASVYDCLYIALAQRERCRLVDRGPAPRRQDVTVAPCAIAAGARLV